MSALDTCQACGEADLAAGRRLGCWLCAGVEAMVDLVLAADERHAARAYWSRAEAAIGRQPPERTERRSP